MRAARLILVVNFDGLADTGPHPQPAVIGHWAAIINPEPDLLRVRDPRNGRWVVIAPCEPCTAIDFLGAHLICVEALVPREVGGGGLLCVREYPREIPATALADRRRLPCGRIEEAVVVVRTIFEENERAIRSLEGQ